MRELPEGTVTFLFTDIEGSTLAWERDATATAVAVTRHYEILDAAVAAHGGVRPQEQGEGDTDQILQDVSQSAAVAHLNMGERQELGGHAQSQLVVDVAAIGDDADALLKP